MLKRYDFLKYLLLSAFLHLSAFYFLLGNLTKKNTVHLSVPVEVFFNSQLQRRTNQSGVSTPNSNAIGAEQQKVDQKVPRVVRDDGAGRDVPGGEQKIKSIKKDDGVQRNVSAGEQKIESIKKENVVIGKTDKSKQETKEKQKSEKSKIQPQTTSVQSVERIGKKTVFESSPSLCNNSESETSQSCDSATVSVGGVGQCCEISFDAKDFEFSYYGRQLGRKIISQSRWVESYGSFRVLVYFKVYRNGTVSDVSIKESSGNREYDKNALDAVLRAVPLPDLPESYPEDFLGVFFEFK